MKPPEPKEPSQTPRPAFTYCRDRIFLLAVGLWALNRFWLRSVWNLPFLQEYASDLLCVPFLLPPTLGLMRLVGTRAGDAPPSASEIAVFLVVFSGTFELLYPNLSEFQTVAYSDPLDVLAYAAGGILAGIGWNARTART